MLAEAPTAIIGREACSLGWYPAHDSPTQRYSLILSQIQSHAEPSDQTANRFSGTIHQPLPYFLSPRNFTQTDLLFHPARIIRTRMPKVLMTLVTLFRSNYEDNFFIPKPPLLKVKLKLSKLFPTHKAKPMTANPSCSRRVLRRCSSRANHANHDSKTHCTDYRD